MKNTKKWLVTVQGYDSYYSPPTVTISKTITLSNTETPVDWFLKNPKLYFRFEFTPVALLNYWEIPDKVSSQCVVYPTECPNKCEQAVFSLIEGAPSHIWKCLSCSRIIDLRVENNYDGQT